MAEIFGWEFNMLEGITFESRVWREQIDPYWSKELNIPDLTPRKVLQRLGTDTFRNNFSENIWSSSLKNKILSSNDDVVITDCRFISEAKEVKKWGGLVVNIRRQSTLPDWMPDLLAIEPREGEKHSTFCTRRAEEFYAHKGVHPAETSLVGYKGFDYTIYNDGTLSDLCSQIDALLRMRVIGIDFDDVICPFMPSFLSFCNRKHGYSLSERNIHTLAFEDFLQCSSEEVREIFSDFLRSGEHKATYETAPTKECVQVLTELSKSNKLVLISARQPSLKKETRDYLDRHLPGVFKSLRLGNCHGMGKKKTKLEICLEERCNVMVDDNPDNFDGLVESGVRPIAFGAYPWNTKWSGDRITEWNSMMSLFKRWES